MPITERFRVNLLRLHTGEDGCVWFGDDRQLAVNSYLEAGTSVPPPPAGLSPCDARKVRVLGTKENATLIFRLWEQKSRRNSDQRILLGAPAVVATASTRSDVAAVLQHLWQPSYSSCLSWFWHEMTLTDACIYAMLEAIEEDGGVSERVRRIARHHPAWPALSFLATCDVEWACQLMAAIVDPRWYRHPTRPGRNSRLGAHLGLTSENVRAFLGDGMPGRNYQRAEAAIRTWYAPDSQTNGPRDFLWQEFRRYKDKAESVLRCTMRLVDLVQRVWTEGVAEHHPETGFNASVFFARIPLDTAVIAAAFEKHRASWKQV